MSPDENGPLDIESGAARLREQFAASQAPDTPEPSAEEDVAETPDVVLEDENDEQNLPEDELSEGEEQGLDDDTVVDDSEEDPGEDEDDSKAEAEIDADETITLDVEQLASLVNLPADLLHVNDDGLLALRTKVDGQTGIATLSELVESYQKDAHLTNRGKALAGKHTEFDSMYEQFVTGSNQLVQQAELTVKVLEDDFLAEDANINWQELREDQPDLYAAKKIEMQERKEALISRRNELSAQVQQLQEGQKKQRDEYLAVKLQTEQEALEEAFVHEGLGKWSAEAKKSMMDYLGEQGFPVESLDGLYDHKILLVIEKARLFDKGQRNLKGKMLRALPRVIKPGAKPSKQSIQNVRKNDLKAAHKKSGTIDSAVALLRQK